MADITHGTWIKDGKAVDAVYQNGRQVYGRNLIIAKTIRSNTSLKSGDPFGYSPSFLTDYIPVVANQKYTISIYGAIGSYVSRIAYYDSSKKFISRESDRNINASSPEVIVMPPETSYIRFSPDTPNKLGEYEDNYKIEKGSVVTDWCPAPEDILN